MLVSLASKNIFSQAISWLARKFFGLKIQDLIKALSRVLFALVFNKYTNITEFSHELR